SLARRLWVEDPTRPLVVRWHGGATPAARWGSTRVFLVVNGHDHDVTALVRGGAQPSGWLEHEVAPSVLEHGWNDAVLRVESVPGSPVAVFVTYQWLYWHGDTWATLDGGASWSPMGEALVTGNQIQPGERPWNHLFRWALLIKVLAAYLVLAALVGPARLGLLAGPWGGALLVAGAVAWAARFAADTALGLWPYLSAFTARVASAIVDPFYPVTVTSDGAVPVVTGPGAGFRINQDCSGADALGLFAILYLAYAALLWRRLRPARAAGLFLAGLAGVCAVNVVRITLLLLIGFGVSAELAAGFFHTHLGWVLFLGYVLLLESWAAARILSPAPAGLDSATDGAPSTSECSVE
ncbi:MAG: archaeosortase/exosortase family protein, partial [Planctomycetota bacterium]